MISTSPRNLSVCQGAYADSLADMVDRLLIIFFFWGGEGSQGPNIEKNCMQWMQIDIIFYTLPRKVVNGQSGQFYATILVT